MAWNLDNSIISIWLVLLLLILDTFSYIFVHACKEGNLIAKGAYL